jgi:hypothetical protein
MGSPNTKKVASLMIRGTDVKKGMRGEIGWASPIACRARGITVFSIIKVTVHW